MNRLTKLLSALFLCCATIASAGAQDFPNKPVTLIVPYPAGGTTDIFMRVVAEAAASKLGQRVIIENRPGGGGATGPGNMAKTAKPDGYTIAQMPVPVFRMPLMQDAPWSKDDFTYIIHLSGYVFAVIANINAPYKTWAEFLDYAKKNPDKITYGHSGVGGSPHLGMEMVAEKAGIKLRGVPYKGAAEYNAAVVGGHIDIAVGGGSSKALADEGKIRFLNVWTSKRVKTMPEVPTLRDLGYPIEIESPFGIAGPKGMDPAVVAKLHDAFKAALEDPSVVAAMERYDQIASYKNSSDYKKAVDDLIVEETALLKRLDLYKK